VTGGDGGVSLARARRRAPAWAPGLLIIAPSGRGLWHRSDRAVLDARTYMLALSEDREMRQQWQRACELILAEADVGALRNQIELALFYDRRLVLR
jgi:hypothetical protein